MSSQFSVGVIIGGAISSTFRSAISGTRRTLDGMSETTRRLQERQATLTQAMERYGNIGSRASQRMNSDLQRVGRTMEQLQRQQNRLSAASATSDAARSNRMALYGQGAEAYAMARTGYEMVSPAIEKSTLFRDKMIDMQITAKYTDQTRDDLAGKLRSWSKEYNQTQEDMQAAMGELISNNIDSVRDIEKYMPSIGRASTATRTSGKDWANIAKAWQLSLSGSAENFGAVQNIIAYTGDQGSFEIPDQVKWIQELAPEIASMLKGERAIAELGASLQIAKIGSNSSDIAANNFRNFLTKIFAKETGTSFASVGIDIKSSIMSHQASGLSPIEGMMNVIELYLKKKSPEALEGFKKAMKLKDDKARDEALKSLAEQYNLGDLFADMQVMAFVRPMLANMDRFRQIRDGALNAAKDDALAKSYETRMRSPLEQVKRLSIATNDLAISIGDQLTPSFISLTGELIPLIQGAKRWVEANPQLVSGAFKVAGALLTFKVASIGARLGLNLLLSPIVDLWKGAMLLRSRWLLLQTAFGAGGRARQWVSGFGNLSRGVLNLTRSLSGGLWRGIQLAGRGLLWMGNGVMAVGRLFAGGILSGIRLLASGVLNLTRSLSGGLWRGIQLAGRGLLWMGNGVMAVGRLFAGGILSGIRLLASGAGWLGRMSLALGRVLGGALLRGITLVGRAVMVMGRALLMNPIGLLVAGIAVSAYLVYRYWEPISNWFRARWNDITTAFSGGIGGVTKLILNWSPIGIFYKVFAEVMKYFGIEVPSKFTDFGANIISGLVNGIENAWEGAKKVVGELGDNIKGWFAEKLGIHSPSRVFASFGDNIAQGAAIGIGRSASLATDASQRFATALIPATDASHRRFTAMIPDIPTVPDINLAVKGREANNPRVSLGNEKNDIHIINNIYIDGKKQSATAELSSALGDISREVERALERILRNRSRVAYD
ncbi:phage tail tape measure protein [Pectobacterium odoriferum]|uniref:Phage tail tape measure protein n=1 Tax=Pectobacterium odoriferum TaxID=78398 RepID=A0ABD6VLK1_9GAMM|nr:phage tail tape measure protein [Pectobacterium odoriferum]POD94217.1 phage tail tape measure protein [Pectobacterium odoriferum]POE10746.1 phage tail tape measure protein [Pectobacterium odoriferum]POE25366.1 phage tail tape measure protein [Pectobacterium odoriferum]POE29730.1 phage tail tape measure protein [Pectobacterium odoriferum]POE38385.1 phage tail tape measure protein [Pectobacterium odoriferum]